MEEIISKLNKLFSEMKREKGNFYLFMVLKMDEFTDKWSILVSAPWITRENQSESFSYIVMKIRQNLSAQELTTIARLGIFQPDEHLVQLITGSIRVVDGANIKIENQKINGYQIHEGYVFESMHP